MIYAFVALGIALAVLVWKRIWIGPPETTVEQWKKLR